MLERTLTYHFGGRHENCLKETGLLAGCEDVRMRGPVAGRRERRIVLASSMKRGEILDQQLFKKSAILGD